MIITGMTFVPAWSHDPINARMIESVQGRQYVILGVSTGDIPVFNEVILFNEDGSCVLKKLEQYGEGEFFEFAMGFFYLIFTTYTNTDIQYVEAAGLSLPGLLGSSIFAVGSIMIDYVAAPMLFTGIEVFQTDNALPQP